MDCTNEMQTMFLAGWALGAFVVGFTVLLIREIRKL